jgi:pentatricopeptide repeat protein
MMLISYGKCGCPEEAFSIFNNIKLSERNIIILTTMILAFGENDKGKEALTLYEKMQKEGVKPNNQTITCFMKACCESGVINTVAEILFSIENKLGIKPNGYHYNCLLTSCAENRLISLGRKIHEHIVESKYIEDVVLITNIINMYGKCGCLEEALMLYKEMQKKRNTTE